MTTYHCVICISPSICDIITMIMVISCKVNTIIMYGVFIVCCVVTVTIVFSPFISLLWLYHTCCCSYFHQWPMKIECTCTCILDDHNVIIIVSRFILISFLFSLSIQCCICFNISLLSSCMLLYNRFIIQLLKAT